MSMRLILDGDDDMDIIAGTYDGTFVWFENTNGAGHFEPRTTSEENLATGSRLYPNCRY